MQTLALTDNDFNNINIWARDTGNGYVLSLFPWDLSNFFSGIGGATTIEHLLDPWIWEQEDELIIQFFGGIIPFRLAERVLSADINDAQNYLYERWAQLREGILSEATINQLFRNYMHQLNDSGASLRDKEKWFDAAEYVTLGEDMALWLQMRCSILDSFFHQIDWPTLWTQTKSNTEGANDG